MGLTHSPCTRLFSLLLWFQLHLFLKETRPLTALPLPLMVHNLDHTVPLLQLMNLYQTHTNLFPQNTNPPQFTRRRRRTTPPNPTNTSTVSRTSTPMQHSPSQSPRMRLELSQGAIRSIYPMVESKP